MNIACVDTIILLVIYVVYFWFVLTRIIPHLITPYRMQVVANFFKAYYFYDSIDCAPIAGLLAYPFTWADEYTQNFDVYANETQAYDLCDKGVVLKKIYVRQFDWHTYEVMYGYLHQDRTAWGVERWLLKAQFDWMGKLRVLTTVNRGFTSVSTFTLQEENVLKTYIQGLVRNEQSNILAPHRKRKISSRDE